MEAFGGAEFGVLGFEDLGDTMREMQEDVRGQHPEGKGGCGFDTLPHGQVSKWEHCDSD